MSTPTTPSKRPSGRRSRKRVAGLLLAGITGLHALGAGPVEADMAAEASTVATIDPVAAGAARALDLLERWWDSGTPEDFVGYVRARDRVAGHVAERLVERGVADIGVDQLIAAWSSTDLDGQGALIAALSQLGVPYRRNTESPGTSFDCSGLTGWAWERAGVELPRYSTSQFRRANEVDHEAAEAGDLVWYPGHIMMYLGVGDAIIHSPEPGRGVEIGELSLRRRRWARFADPTDDTRDLAVELAELPVG
jgi:cell wall-associated NlpC family hydrolase